MKIVSKDGSLAGAAITTLLAVGLLLFFGSLAWAENHYLRLIGFCVGLTLIATAGYAGQAKALGLRSFGRSEWRSAKSSYANEPSPHADAQRKDST